MHEYLCIFLSAFLVNLVKFPARIPDIAEHVFVIVLIVIREHVSARHLNVVVDVAAAVSDLRQVAVDLPVAAVHDVLVFVSRLVVYYWQGQFESPLVAVLLQVVHRLPLRETAGDLHARGIVCGERKLVFKGLLVLWSPLWRLEVAFF